MRLLVLVLGVLTVTVAVSPAVASPVRATMSTSSTKPFAGTPWRYTVTVKELDAGTFLAAKMRLQVLDKGRVVGCWKRGAIRRCSGGTAGTWIAFPGRRTDVIAWAPRYTDVRLTFQATIVAGASSLQLRAPVTVQRPPGLGS